MCRVFKDRGAGNPVTLEAVVARMEALGAEVPECEGLLRTVESFSRWSGRRSRAGDREAGLAWLREIRARLPLDRYEVAKAGLTTWFHLTGAALAGGGKSEGGVLDGGGLSQGGRMGGQAVSWKEAGERLKGYLACKSYSRNTVECYVGWARRFCGWCRKSGRELPEVESGEIRGFLEWLAGTGVVAKTQNQALNALVAFFRHGMGKEPGEIGDYLRAKISRRLPVVLDRKEAAAVMGDLEGRNRAMWLMAGVMLGAGLRQKEVLELTRSRPRARLALRAA